MPSTITSTATERRAARRIPFHGLVNKVQDGIASICRATDLSSRGMSLHSVATAPAVFQGEAVAVEFQLPHLDEVFVVHGRAVRRQGRAFGIEFTRISPRHKAMIDGWIAASRGSL